MFRQMRRKNQELTYSQAVEILKRAKTGVLAVFGDDDYPYAVPLNYLYTDNKIIFHCAKSGHKIDAIKKHDKVSFCVIDKDDIMPEKFGTDFKSVIVFGKARILETDEIMPLIQAFTRKYCQFDDNTIQKEIDREFKLLCMAEIKIEHMTGKQASDFIRNADKSLQV